ncbi:glycosyltransferase [Falsirhodobacter sp. 1013]|uniref:glycosyltransferase n=1 Tax=Falsirhodobacter sp. 1013 TaxID=3417566 RepID=UPI003EB7DD46
MKILFVNTHYYMPQSYGGMANTLHQLCLGLKSRGHEVVVLSGFRKARDVLSLRNRIGMAARKRFTGTAASRDTRLSYPVWRSWNPQDAVEGVAKAERPDVIVVMGGAVVPVAHSARRTGLPTVIQVHDVEDEWHKGDFREVVDLPVIANSKFTAEVYRTRHGANAQVIYPFMPLEDYKVVSSRRRVTFINPIFRKGLRTAYEVARLCPQIPFTFVGNLPDTDEQDNPVNPNRYTLPNVIYQPFCSDMREVYGECRILFVPSQWDEAYGRVVNEAQISGIPVLASTRGGIPEAVEGGGLLLDADAPPEVWAEALNKMNSDVALYDKLSEAAIRSAERPELNPHRQMKAHEDALMQAIRMFGDRGANQVERT